MILNEKRKELAIGSNDTITICKEYGPLIMCDLRITADSKNRKWIIEKLLDSEKFEEVIKIDSNYE